MFRQLIRLRTIAQVIHRNAAAQIDMLERQSCFAVDRHEVIPHALERFGERLDIRCLRSHVNVYAADVNQIRVLQTAPERVQHF